MNDLIALLIVWLVTAVSFVIISKIPIGVEIDSFNKALISAAVFGLLNAIVKPVLAVITFPITILTLGLFWLFLNVIIFGLAAWLVTGFRLRWGIWSAILGALALAFVQSVLMSLLGQFGLAIR
jgi:putative membrane protein